ncbi:hypothetical protein GCM10011583_14970 [Streptomyces camponoticapitis]|uniref:LPXTG cell wall anchor domain-containing protein n=1 Tax=Streptomyces camponoticapitis TaxID=1616125 RepID=A0ABQ2E0C2_9ACTN|nr:hypothetical protein [Streptomyces camponoticapitis]GGJ84320.1 hypothetical protein GCM10011583_14970 [Streptomyces camponoticapitis]
MGTVLIAVGIMIALVSLTLRGRKKKSRHIWADGSGGSSDSGDGGGGDGGSGG